MGNPGHSYVGSATHSLIIMIMMLKPDEKCLILKTNISELVIDANLKCFNGMLQLL